MQEDIERKLLEIVGYAEQIPQIRIKLDNTISAARALNGTIRDLASALNTRDDVQTKAITKLNSESEVLHALVMQVASDLDTIRDDVLEKIAALRAQVAALHDLIPNIEDK